MPPKQKLPPPPQRSALRKRRTPVAIPFDPEATQLIPPPKKTARVTSRLDMVLSYEDPEAPDAEKKIPYLRKQNSEEADLVAEDFNKARQELQIVNASHEAMRKNFLYGPETKSLAITNTFFQLIKNLLKRVYLLTQFKNQAGIEALLSWINILSKHESGESIPDEVLIFNGVNFKKTYLQLKKQAEEADTQDEDSDNPFKIIKDARPNFDAWNKALFEIINNYPNSMKDIIVSVQERLKIESHETSVKIFDSRLPLLVFVTDKFLDEVVLPRVFARTLVLKNQESQLYFDLLQVGINLQHYAYAFCRLGYGPMVHLNIILIKSLLAYVKDPNLSLDTLKAKWNELTIPLIKEKCAELIDNARGTHFKAELVQQAPTPGTKRKASDTLSP